MSCPTNIAMSQKLPDVPGKTLTALLVGCEPGGNTPKHRHPGCVMAFVVSGAVRSPNSSTGPARVYHAGEAFYEPPGGEHLSENASATEPASLLAVFVAEDGATLRIDDP
jgi:quercetin dioxygenase-like cupin family protein